MINFVHYKITLEWHVAVKTKMSKQLFSKNPWVWFHYAILVAVVFVAHHFSGFIEKMVMNPITKTQGWILLAIWYFVWISVADQIVHYLLPQTD